LNENVCELLIKQSKCHVPVLDTHVATMAAEAGSMSHLISGSMPSEAVSTRRLAWRGHIIEHSFMKAMRLKCGEHGSTACFPIAELRERFFQCLGFSGEMGENLVATRLVFVSLYDHLIHRGRLFIETWIAEANFFATFAAKVIDTLASEALDEAQIGAFVVAMSKLIAVEAGSPRRRMMGWEGQLWRGSEVVRHGRVHW
jgi:hypothetical protein